MTITESDVTATVDRYLAAYGEPDPQRRAELIATVWADNGRLIDPPLAAEGHDGIAGMSQALQQQFPGHGFRRTSAVDIHHEHFRFTWELVSPSGDVVLAGLDVGELDADGRVRRITGFFGDLPAAA